MVTVHSQLENTSSRDLTWLHTVNMYKCHKAASQKWCEQEAQGALYLKISSMFSYVKLH